MDYWGTKKVPDNFEIITLQITSDNLEKIVKIYETYVKAKNERAKKLRELRGSKPRAQRAVSVKIVSSEKKTREECEETGLFINPGTRTEDSTIYQFRYNEQTGEYSRVFESYDVSLVESSDE